VSYEWSPAAGRMIEVDVLEPVAQSRRPDKAKQHRDGVWDWTKVDLVTLTSKKGEQLFSRRTRLLLYLRIKSQGGKRRVTLTNEMAAEVGLDRNEKRVCLLELEALGYVVVERRGKRNPTVTVRP
jgi:hypothetical protein